MGGVTILPIVLVVCLIRCGAFMNFIGPCAKLGLYTKCSIGCIPPYVQTFVPKLKDHATKLGMFRQQSENLKLRMTYLEK